MFYTLIFFLIGICLLTYLFAGKKKSAHEETGTYVSKTSTINASLPVQLSSGIDLGSFQWRASETGDDFFEISIPCVSNGVFEITLEENQDRWAKLLGLTQEVELSIHELDQNFFLASPCKSELKTLLQNTIFVSNLRLLFQMGFNKLTHDGQRLYLSRTSKKHDCHLLRESTELLSWCEQLISLSKVLPSVFSTASASINKLWLQTRKGKSLSHHLHYQSLLIMGLAGIIFYKYYNVSVINYLQIDLILLVAIVSTLISLLFFLFIELPPIKLNLKGQSVFNYMFTPIFVIFVCSYWIILALNSKLDKASPSHFRVVVNSKYMCSNNLLRSRKRRDYCLSLEDWTDQNRDIDIYVSRETYNTIQSGQTIQMTTSPGKFGFEWTRTSTRFW